MSGKCCALWAVAALLVSAGSVRAQVPPPDLPRYDLQVHFDTAKKVVRVQERVTWINRHQRPADELVFTINPLFQLATKDIPLLAKTVELLRQTPSDALAGGPAGKLERVRHNDQDLAFVQRTDIPTAVSIPLSKPINKGESITVELEYVIELPNKQGRWGHWNDVCYLANWLPQLAVYDEAGWRPVPFIPWHQPFFHEAGVFTAKIVIPKDQVLSAPAMVAHEADRGDGWKEITLQPAVLRDFALVASSKFQEHIGESTGVRIRVVALPEHAPYAKRMVEIACEALPYYTKWFGPYPYPQLTVTESYFPWNGNECAGMVWLDHRVFQMPMLADGYVDYLLTHEICHQWWYNLVGTNGYAETFMDEGPATYFSHRVMNAKHGKNSEFLRYPKGFGWLPNIRRESYRYAGWYSAVQRNESSPAVQSIDQYRHIYDLFSGAYDRGSRIWGMIEDRLGEAAFLDFTRIVVRKYSFRIMRAADLQRELEEYTCKSWDGFFQEWIFGPGIVDWRVRDVRVDRQGGGAKVELILEQTRQLDEPTVLAVKYEGSDHYVTRIPIHPDGGILKVDDPPTQIEPIGDHKIRVVMQLPQEPIQITVDPDNVLPDADPVNNHWRTPIRYRWTPLYTQIDDAGMVNDYDRWTIQAGPWLYLAAAREPWYARSLLAGFRVGAVRPEHFGGGAFIAYRNDVNDIVIGADGEWNHFPFPKTAVGFHVEKRVFGPFGEDGPSDVTRAVMYGRWIHAYTASTYQNPVNYTEVFATYQDNALPFVNNPPPGSVRPNEATLFGLHYHLDMLTPYWDPEGGFSFDTTYSGGIVDLDGQTGTQRINGQFTVVSRLPSWTGPLHQTRLAARLAGAAGWPERGLYYSLGGNTLYRGYDLADRQGNAFWVVNLEWRIPLVRHLDWDVCDHIAGLRGIYLAPFYDVGAAFANGHQAGQVAHALGMGLRWDVSVFSFIERAIIRLDVAKTINDSTPVQVWFGVLQPF
jgi:hypothetical protein